MKMWLNGDLLDADRAHISPLDRGFLLGEGVFETFRSYEGRVPTAGEHLERLQSGCGAIGLDGPGSDDLLIAARALLRENELGDARIRITVTAQTILITAAPLDPWPETARAAIAPWPHNELSPLTGVKTTSRADTLMAREYARREGADEALFFNLAGNLCEATTANVFLVRDGCVETPPLWAGCLPGITRARVLGLCGELGVDAVETDISRQALEEAQETFLTSSTRGIQPLDTPGPVTLQLQEQLARALEALPDA
jgi:branched-chain amino acid aminotransferase